MLPQLKRNLFTIFAVFFVSLTPFLIIFSLGYSINLDKPNSALSSSLSVNLKTLPSGSTMKVDDSTFSTPIDFKIANNYNLTFTVSKNDYKEEKFSVWSKTDSNDLANFENLVLLPTKSSTLIDGDVTSIDRFALLSDTTLLYRQGGLVYVQNFDLSGLVGKRFDVSPANNTPDTVFSNQWRKLSSTSFWLQSEKMLLTKGSGTSWFLKSLDRPFGSVTSVRNTIATVDGQFIVLDSRDNLWLVDQAQDGDLTWNFLESGVSGISQTSSPQFDWIWKGSGVYRVEKKRWNSQQFILGENIFWTNDSINISADISEHILKVKGVSQGILVQINSQLYFIPDFDSSKWRIVADNVHTFDVDSNTVFWVDRLGIISAYNFLFKTGYTLGNTGESLVKDIPLDGLKLSYFFQWKRLFIYTKNSVTSVWFDKDVINSGISQYYPGIWINGKDCLPQIVDKFQFCSNNNKIELFKNTEIW
jgi:hypothetical protein